MFTREELLYLEDALQRDAVNFLRNEGEQGIPAYETINSEHYRANRTMFGKIWDLLYADSDGLPV